MNATTPISLAVLVSGSGTTLQNLIDQIDQKRLNAQIKLVLGSKRGILGTARAMKADIPTQTIDRKSFGNVFDFSNQVFAEMDRVQPDLIVLAGWLCLLNIPAKYLGRVMNIHPALLPRFGGKGMYGSRVHQAVIDHGCKISGCTVHFVDNEYDAGPIILQRACPVMENDTADDLAHRVFEEEKIAYPEAIRLFQQGRLNLEGRRVRIRN